MGISDEEIESCIQLWKILVNLELTYTVSSHWIVQFALFWRWQNLAECFQLIPEMCKNKNIGSNHTIAITTDIVQRYFFQCKSDYIFWSSAICNFEQLCIESERLALLDSNMNALSAHGRLEYVILNINFVTQNVIVILIQNSPHLITCHVPI